MTTRREHASSPTADDDEHGSWPRERIEVMEARTKHQSNHIFTKKRALAAEIEI